MRHVYPDPSSVPAPIDEQARMQALQAFLLARCIPAIVTNDGRGVGARERRRVG